MRFDTSHGCPDPSAVTHDGDRAHCARCGHDVLDLRYVTERRATALIAREEAEHGRACVTIFVDEDGNASFLADAEPRRRLPVLPLALAVAVAGCDPEAPRASPTPVLVTTPVEQAPPPTSVAPVPPIEPPVVDAGTPDAATCAEVDAGAPPRGHRSRRTHMGVARIFGGHRPLSPHDF